MFITSASEIDERKSTILQAIKLAQDSFSYRLTDPLSWMRDTKFNKQGFDPVSHKPLNLIEQVNQTFTYLVALEATRILLSLHPDAGGFHLAPGAHASQPLDIMSAKTGLVGAECFAAVDPRNNKKLQKDITKLLSMSEQYRYVFFSSPLYPKTERQTAIEGRGVEVWSVAL